MDAASPSGPTTSARKSPGSFSTASLVVLPMAWITMVIDWRSAFD